MASIYEITGEKFFTPLASKNRKVYIDAILFLKRIINELFENQENDKAKVVDALTNHLNDLANVRFFNDETGDEVEEFIDNSAKAALIINNLKDYGWLSEESIGNSKIALDFNSYSYDFIALIEELMANKKPQYTSYVRQINNALDRFNKTRLDDLNIVDKALSDFVVALRGLRSNIQRYYKNITKNKSQIDLEKLLEEFTGEYKEYFFDSSYVNLKIRDGVDTEIPKIEERLEDILDDYLCKEDLIKAKMKEKGFEDYNKAYKAIEEIHNRIMSNIKTIPSIIEMIDSKNEKYVTRTISVIIHLINRGEDIEGILNRLIDYVKQNDVDDNYISIFEMKHYTYNALSKPRKNNPKPKPEMLEINVDISTEERIKTINMLKEDKKYNIHAVNDFVSNFIKGYNERKISELIINSKYELIMIVSIMIYSKMPNAVYELELLNERVNNNGVTFNDFILKRRGGTDYDK